MMEKETSQWEMPSGMTEERENSYEQMNSILEQKENRDNTVLARNTGFFIITAFLYSIGFVIAFYKNYAGLTFPLITIATLIVCGLFLKKSGIRWKTKNLYYIVPIVLLGISTMLTTNVFTIFFNTVGILLLITVFMLQQVYPENNWHPVQYVCNIIVLYCYMIPEIAAPFSNIGIYIRKKRRAEQKNSNLKYVIIGIFIGIPMLIFVVLLLNSADAVFSEYIGSGLRFLCKNIVFSPNIILVVSLMLLGFFGIYAFLSALSLKQMTDSQEKIEKKNPIIAITFTGMITVIYLIFSIIQIVFLFSGGLMLPEGYTYAEYAHQGFFQLLFLCIFNLVLVLCCMSLFEMSRWLKVILLVFSACTYVMIASSAYRMILYISCYHLTFLRMLVLWFLALLVVLMAGVMWSIQKKNFPLLQYGVAVVTVFYLVLSFSHFDYWIAKYNLSQMGDQIAYEDISYLCNLSMDAVPALAEISLEHAHESESMNKYDVDNGYDADIRYEYSEEYDIYWSCPACEAERYLEWVAENPKLNIRTFNLSKYRAVKAAGEYVVE